MDAFGLTNSKWSQQKNSNAANGELIGTSLSGDDGRLNICHASREIDFIAVLKVSCFNLFVFI